MDPCIAHVDIDAFFASVEQRLVPALRGKPVAVGSGCIASASYEAREYGLHAGTSLAEARRLCPEIVILPGSYGVYRCFTERIWELCREIAPAVETHLDDAYLDLTGTELLYGDPRGPIEELRKRIHEDTGLTVTAGIGPNRMIARLAGKTAKPDGLAMVRPEEIDAFLIDRAVADIPGVGPKTAATLAKFSIRTARDLRTLSRRELVALFGKVGDALYDRARGRDTRAIAANEIPRTISRETTFHKETTDPAEIRGMLHYLVERAMKAVRELGLVARTVGVKIRYADFKGRVAPGPSMKATRRGDEARTRLTEATGLEGPVFESALALLGRLHTRRVALRLVGVTLSGLSIKGADQMSLLEDEDDWRGQLADAIDEVRGRFGFSALTAGRSLDLLGKLRQDTNGYVLRTPCLTK
jgi:DNA polymerase-4